MTEDHAGWDLVAARLRRELDLKGVSIRAVETATGVNFRTLQKLLAGEPVTRRDRLAKLAEYLGWAGDAFDRLRRGEEPEPLASNVDDDLRLRAIERRLDRIEALIEDALQPPDRPAGGS